jgi:hypothetical protein
MKTIYCCLLTVLSLFSGAVFAQNDQQLPVNHETKAFLAEAACGQCQFKLKGSGCNLAVRINGKAWFVDGAHIDSFGDAHAETGFCNTISKVMVKGKLVNDRFQANHIALYNPKKKKRTK